MRKKEEEKNPNQRQKLDRSLEAFPSTFLKIFPRTFFMRDEVKNNFYLKVFLEKFFQFEEIMKNCIFV